MSSRYVELFVSRSDTVERRGFHVPSAHVTGMKLFMRHLAPTTGSNLRPVLFVHGAVLAGYFWDIDLEGHSWMVHMARGGRPAFALDIRGYGGSDKPPAMSDAPGAHAPIVRGSEALEDIDDAVEVVKERTGFKQVDLIGGSWGSITAGMYASGPGRDKIHKMILYAPIFCTPNNDWLEMLSDPQFPERLNPTLGSYRWVTEEDIRTRWDKEIPVESKEEWRSEQCFQAMIQEAFRWDIESAGRETPAFRTPNGTLVDLFEAFSGRPLYEPERIQVPTLLVRGADDLTAVDSDARELFRRLGSRVKRYVEVEQGTHFLVGERNRGQLYSVTANFLE